MVHLFQTYVASVSFRCLDLGEAHVLLLVRRGSPRAPPAAGGAMRMRTREMERARGDSITIVNLFFYKKYYYNYNYLIEENHRIY